MAAVAALAEDETAIQVEEAMLARDPRALNALRGGGSLVLPRRGNPVDDDGARGARGDLEPIDHAHDQQDCTHGNRENQT